jgi:hypothetical protein
MYFFLALSLFTHVSLRVLDLVSAFSINCINTGTEI